MKVDDTDRPGVTAVVVTYNSAGTVEECLASLLKSQCVERVIVIDNGSADRTQDIVRYLAARDGRFELRYRPDNPGYAVSVNVGWTTSSSPFVLVLNPDTVIPARSIDRLVDDACKAPDSILAPVTRDSSGNKRGVRRIPTIVDLVIRGGGRVEPLEQVSGLEAVGQPDGAALLIRTEHLERLHGFDEGFPLYYEDVDLAARAAGHQIGRLVSHEVEIHHIGGVSFGSASKEAYLRSRVGRVRYTRIHHGRIAALIVTYAVLLEGLGRWAAARLGRRASGTPAAGLAFYARSTAAAAAELFRQTPIH